MEKMKVLNKDAYAWLEKMPPNTWVRAFFSEYQKCDILLTTLAKYSTSISWKLENYLS